MRNSFFILVFVSILAGNLRADYQCTNQLEDQLADQPDWILAETPAQGDEVSVSCIERSMQVFYSWTSGVREERAAQGKVELGHYVYCDPKSDRIIKKHEPPCPTSNYINTIKNSYNSVFKCLGFSPKELFAITAVESGFQINTLSLAGVDIGIGQLTPIAVDDVNPHWQQYLDEIAANGSPECENLRPYLAEMTKVEADLTCGLTDLPENPIKNLVYISFLHKKNQDYMNRLFDIHGIPSKIADLVGRYPTVDELAHIKDILVTLSYNSGSPTAVQALEDFMEYHRQPMLAVDNQIYEMSREAGLLYLSSVDAQVQGDANQAQVLLAERALVLEEIADLQETKQALSKPIQIFAIDGAEDSFGEHLTKTETSFYLHILKDRIQYVEDGIQSPGACAPEGYLESI